MSNTVKTTGEKISELFTPRLLDRMDKEGLRVVDRVDFETMVKQNNDLAFENRTLRLRIRELESQLGRQTRLL